MKIASVEITHPEKILFPKKKITKGEVARYYESIADKMLPFLKDRPLSLVRFPSGIKNKGFFQKNAADYFPDYIKKVEIETEEGTNIQVVCNNKKSLLYLANQNTIEFHTWLSKKDILRKPDKIVFDLDPPKNSFERVKAGAGILKEYLSNKNHDPFLMTTGKNGLHVYYSTSRRKDFDKVKEEVREYAEELVQLYPDLFTTNIRKNKRKGKIFLDYLRNAYAQTSVCPYSLRANEAAGIATPLAWDDLAALSAADSFQLPVSK